MNKNLLRQISWLWKHRHTHDGDVASADQVTTIIREIERVSEVSAVGGTGAHIHLLSTGTQTIPVDGAQATWEAAYGVLPHFEFDLPVFPAITVRIKKAGYYNVAVELEWEAFTGGEAEILHETEAVSA